MRKRALLLLCVFLATLAVHSGAQEPAALSVNGFEYTLGEDGTAAITKYVITQIKVPSEVDGHPVTVLGKQAINFFNETESIVLPDSLIEIQDFALYNNKALKSILIPAGVTVIGYGALEACQSLPAINVAPDNPVYESVDGVLYDKQQKALHTYPGGKADERYEVSAGTAIIGDYAFSRTKIKEISLPDSVTEIGFGAFKECAGLTGIQLPAGVTAIDGIAFRGCTGLVSMIVPQGVTWMGSDVFADCPGLTITVVEGSYAHNYAVEKGIPFIIAAQ